MGSTESKAPKKELSSFRVQTLCTMVKVHLQEYKKTLEQKISAKEQNIMNEIRYSAHTRTSPVEIQQISLIVEFLLQITAADAIIRKAEVLKDYSHVISKAGISLTDIKDLVPFISNICWGKLIFKLNCIETFEEEFVNFFGIALLQQLQIIDSMDERIRKAISPPIVASFEDQNGYVNRLCQRYQISIEQFNGDIHGFVYCDASKTSYNYCNSSRENIYCNTSNTSGETNITNNSNHLAKHYSEGQIQTSELKSAIQQKISAAYQLPQQNVEEKKCCLLC